MPHYAQSSFTHLYMAPILFYFKKKSYFISVQREIQANLDADVYYIYAFNKKTYRNFIKMLQNAN